MGSLLSEFSKNNKMPVTQNTGQPGSKDIAGLDQLFVVVPERVPAAAWRRLPQGGKVQALMRRREQGAVPAVTTRVNNKRQTNLSLASLKPGSSAFEQLDLGRKLFRAGPPDKGGRIGIWVLGFDDADTGAIAGRLVAAARAAAFSLPQFKEKPKPARIKSVRVLGLPEELDLDRINAEADGNNLARWLTAMPPNKLDATAYVELLRELAKERGWQFRKHGVAELKKLGAGAFLAVAQGNADDSAAIVHLRYRPTAKSAKPALALAGKGIIFDTGGNNLKPFASMVDMHIDMGGSAVAVGTLLAMSTLQLPIAVDCWLAITENRIGPTAYKSQDVVTAVNGKTIQAIHTDAEGRMALADTLALACREQPGLVIDYATLTGACINAVTRRYCGVFTNRQDLHPLLKKAGRDSGERVWPFPADKEFLSELESETADIRQCAPDAAGDHILAAAFLSEFVTDDVPWIHLDLSAAKHKDGLGHVGSDITGFGVRYTLHLVLDKNVLEDGGQQASE